MYFLPSVFVFIFLLFFITYLDSAEVSVCKAVKYSGSITENSYTGTENVKIYSYSFNVNVYKNDANETYPNKIIISNFNDWSLNNLMYGRTSPLRLKYDGREDMNIFCPSMNETCVILFPNGKAHINFEFLNYGEIIDYSNIYFKDGIILDGAKGYLMDNEKMPCLTAKTDYSFLNVDLSVCCTDYENLEISDYNMDTCEEFVTVTCWFMLQNSQMQIMNFNCYMKEQSQKFENVIVGELIAEDRMLLKNKNELFTPENSCWSKAAEVPFTSRATYTSTFCCKKFVKRPPDLDADVMSSVSSTDLLTAANSFFPSTPISTDNIFMSSSSSTIDSEINNNLSEEGLFTMFDMWLIIGGAIIFLIIILTVYQLVRRRKAFKKQQIFQNVIQRKAEEIKFSDCKIKNAGKCWITYFESNNLVIDFNTPLGKGSNATVYKAQLNVLHPSYHLLNKIFNKRFNYTVAAKLPTQFQTHDAQEFIRELNSLMILESHINILTVLGWTLYCETPVLVTELAENNLLIHIQSTYYDSSLKSNLQILWQISRALEYVAENKLIHRDVACRNILITTENIIKLADFGLCCFYDDKTLSFQDTGHQRFPIKWLSIEVLTNHIFSEKSDVWAFGVLCFELFSRGKIPYSNVLNSELLDFLKNGNRLKKPDNASFPTYDLMLRCWSEKPTDRPTFTELTKSIRLMLEKEIYGYLSLISEN